MRELRQQRIRDVLATSMIATQHELLDELKATGMAVDQSTLSRDLAELGIRKSRGRYVLNGPEEEAPAALDYRAAVTGFTTCGPHLIVIRTAVGQAQPVALAIDRSDDPAIVATLAGDDTIFVATRNSKAAAMREE